MWTQVEANLEARAGVGEGRSVQAAETTSTVCVFEVSRAEVRLETLGHREGTAADPDGRLNNLKQATAVVERLQSDVLWPDYNSEKTLKLQVEELLL